jgi:hypothetical protein
MAIDNDLWHRWTNGQVRTPFFVGRGFCYCYWVFKVPKSYSLKTISSINSSINRLTVLARNPRFRVWANFLLRGLQFNFMGLQLSTAKKVWDWLPNILWFILLDKQQPFFYIQSIPKRVLIKATHRKEGDCASCWPYGHTATSFPRHNPRGDW